MLFVFSSLWSLVGVLYVDSDQVVLILRMKKTMVQFTLLVYGTEYIAVLAFIVGGQGMARISSGV